MASRNTTGTLLTIVSAALLAAAGYAIFFIAPEERTMRAVQRIFYMHVASAWTASVAYLIVFIASIKYLVRRRPQDDALGVSAAEVGVALNTVVLVTGPIWAKPVWGVWWTWDARLTSTFVLWVMYVSYLLLRTLVEDATRRAVLSAVYGIFAFLDVPLVYMSIRWWRTQHPQPVIAGGPGSGLDSTMRAVLFFTWFGLLALMTLLIRQRYRLELLRQECAEIRLQLDARREAREASGGVPAQELV
jgi:heme exporter protein C